ncbi:MAG: hypothetical protein ABRQ26_12975 [Syntrophomonadaceae bacterium]
MQTSKRSMQQCLSLINDAKREIESVGRSVSDQTVRAEIDQAYNSLNDSWNHCNTAIQKL